MHRRTVGYLRFGPFGKILRFLVPISCARRTGTAARVERKRRERCALLAVRGRQASLSDTRAASQAFERMHNTLSHRSET